MISSSEIQVNSIIGDINARASVFGTVSVSPLSISADVSLGSIEVIHSDMPDYEGEYAITPGVGEQTLNTANRTLRDDMVINPIPYTATTNLSGGYTVIIGG